MGQRRTRADRRFPGAGLSLIAALALAGCYESTDVTLHKPHVYKGKTDARDVPEDHRERLAERFRQVQTDR